MAKKSVDLIIMDVDVLNEEDCICDIIMSNESRNEHILFMANQPDANVISRCSKFNPEGIVVKPFTEDVLKQTIEKILLRESYMEDFGKV